MTFTLSRANAPIFGIDKDGNVNEWNEKTAEITGFSSKEALGKPLVSTFIVPKLQATVRNILDSALNGKETSNYELEFTTKSNEIRYLLGKITVEHIFNTMPQPNSAVLNFLISDYDS